MGVNNNKNNVVDTVFYSVRKVYLSNTPKNGVINVVFLIVDADSKKV
jgi:hypothetical protein